jgi:hypothetical protein
MPDNVPRYVIFVEDDGDGVMQTAPLAPGDADYFLGGILPALNPLSDDEYMNGPAALLHTLAKSSYVLHATSVYWCVEWSPGLVVVRFSPDGTMAWAAFRSPNPRFGGREPLEIDLRDYDEDDTNHQYNLVFDAWDSQFEDDMRQFHGFEPAAAKTVEVYEAAFRHANALGERLQTQYPNGPKFDRWLSQCKLNISQQAGEGIRLPKRGTGQR